MDNLSTSAAVSFDGDQDMENPTVDYDFNDILSPHDEQMGVETESVVDKNDQLDPDTNFMALNWERPVPSSLLPDCFFEFDTTLDGFVDGALEPTEVSEDEMDTDSSSSLEHRFEETARRLAESMEKSRRSRISLSVKSPTVAQYPRRKSISNVVISVEESSHQILSTFGGLQSPTPSSDL
eukprot:scaffold16707_cov182-Amphora_coffeaeformis.AAC.10